MENNANYIKAKVNNTQKNSKCRVRNETVNHEPNRNTNVSTTRWKRWFTRRLPYSRCFVRCWFKVVFFFNIARSILLQLPSSYFSVRLVSIHVVHPSYRIDTTAAWKKLRFILSYKSVFHMIDSQSIAVHAFAKRKLMSFSLEDTLPPRYVNLSTNFREPLFRVKMSPFW